MHTHIHIHTHIQNPPEQLINWMYMQQYWLGLQLPIWRGIRGNKAVTEDTHCSYLDRSTPYSTVNMAWPPHNIAEGGSSLVCLCSRCRHVCIALETDLKFSHFLGSLGHCTQHYHRLNLWQITVTLCTLSDAHILIAQRGGGTGIQLLPTQLPLVKLLKSIYV